jgi:hypothetical protein
MTEPVKPRNRQRAKVERPGSAILLTVSLREPFPDNEQLDCDSGGSLEEHSEAL